MVAFVLSLLGGVFILLGGGMMSVMGSYGYGGMMSGYWNYGMMGGYRPVYSPWYGMMGGYGFTGLIGIATLLFGVGVIIASVMLYNYPADHSKWGIAILVFSALSVLGGATGGLVGLILGVLGAIFAITWKPPAPSKA